MSFFNTGKLPFILNSEEGKVLNVLGDLITVKLSGEQTNGEYAILEGVSPPQGGPPLHIHHREDEAFYVLEGECEVICGNEKFRVTPGSFVFAPRDIPHTFRKVSAGPSKVLIIVSPAGIEKFFEELSQLPQDGPPDIEKVIEIARRYEIEFVLQQN
jgi:quercetin dioxygenase-like cupin family protein